MTRPTTPRTRRKAAIEPDTSPPLHFLRVVGLDLSLTLTGAFIIRRFPHEEFPQQSAHTIGAQSLTNDATLEDRAHRNRRMATAITDYVCNLGPADLLIMEAPSLGITRATGSYTWDRAGLWWDVVQIALQLGIPVVTVAPATRAMWATGSGKADKAAVAAAMTRRLPDITFANSDEADAAALAYIGAQRIGWRPVATKNEQERLEVITWPKGVHA